jgi:hypothetical protein
VSQRTGIEVRHKKACASRRGARCNCDPAYQASVWSARESKRIRKTFATLAEARAWRAETQTGVRRGTLRAPAHTTLAEAAEELVAGMKSGRIRTRSGDPYKASTLRGYEQGLADHVLPELGAAKLSEIRRGDVQDLADRMLGTGADPSTIRNAIAPLKASSAGNV